MPIIGDFLISGDAGYTEWFHRGGSYAYFLAQIILISTADVTIDIYHKNAEESGPGTFKESFSAGAYTTVGIKEKLSSGLRELVRLKFTVTVTGGGQGPAWTRIRMLPPVFFDKAPA
jgi:hypothetical protein